MAESGLPVGGWRDTGLPMSGWTNRQGSLAAKYRLSSVLYCNDRFGLALYSPTRDHCDGRAAQGVHCLLPTVASMWHSFYQRNFCLPHLIEKVLDVTVDDDEKYQDGYQDGVEEGRKQFASALKDVIEGVYDDMGVDW